MPYIKLFSARYSSGKEQEMNEFRVYKPDYRQDYFWTKRDEDGAIHYYFKIKDELVEVSDEVYAICYNDYRREKYQNVISREYEITSMDSPNGDGFTYYDILFVSDDIEKEVDYLLLKELILKYLSFSSDYDSIIIEKCILNEYSQTEVAELLKISQQAVSKRLKRIKKDLQIIIKEWYKKSLE